MKARMASAAGSPAKQSEEGPEGYRQPPPPPPPQPRTSRIRGWVKQHKQHGILAGSIVPAMGQQSRAAADLATHGSTCGGSCRCGGDG